MGFHILTTKLRDMLTHTLCLLLTIIFLAGILVCASPAANKKSTINNRNKARAVAEKVIEAMGGWESWKSTRYLRFSFFGFRTHYWDKDTGRYRVSWTDRRSGHSQVILMNLNSKKGKVYTDGIEVTDVKTSTGSAVKFVLTEQSSDGFEEFKGKVKGFPSYMVKEGGELTEVDVGDRSESAIISAAEGL